MYLVPGGIVYPGGVPGLGVYLVLGGVSCPGGVPGPGGGTCLGTPPPVNRMTGQTDVKILPYPKLCLRAVIRTPKILVFKLKGSLK